MTTRKLGRTLLVAALALSLVLSITGGTIAWFTDEVTSANNIITSGTLDVELYAGTTKVENTTALFDDVSLWEPGAVTWENLTVKNEGSLALKYQMTMNATNENSVEGNGLSTALQVGITNAPIAADASREAVLADVKEWFNFSDFSIAGNLVEKNAANAYGVVIYWAPKANDNAWNVNNGKSTSDNADHLHITLGVKLNATQLASESDSFNNQYDAGAKVLSIWNGTVPAEMPATLIVDGATQTVHVEDAAAFAYLSTLSDKWAERYTNGKGRDFINYANGKGANYYYSNQWTISLDADIDLNNHKINPVNIMIGEATGATAFNGNNHVIRNINTTTGLFANNTRVSCSNLVLENVKATNGALAGSAKEPITNVTVKNATISGTDYVGGLVGSAFSSVNGCAVIDSDVTATGKEAGGLIGYIETSSSSSVKNNTVKNVSVYANNRAAGLVAQVNLNVKVYNNTVDTVTVGAEDTSKYKPNAVVSNALDSNNVYDNTVINETTHSNVTMVGNAEELFAFANDVNVNGNSYAGKLVVLTADIDMKDAYYSNWTPIGQTGATQFQGTFDGHGYTIKNLNIDSSKQTGANYSSGLFGWLNNATVKNLTIENATVTGNHNVGVIAGYMETAGCTISNCHVVNATVVGKHANDDACGDKVGVIVGHAGNAGVKVENCTAKDSTVTAGRDAGQIAGAAKTENAINCSATNVTVTYGGDCTGANVNNAVIGRIL